MKNPEKLNRLMIPLLFAIPLLFQEYGKVEAQDLLNQSGTTELSSLYRVANVRSQPALSSNIVATEHSGTLFQFSGSATGEVVTMNGVESNQWLEIQLDDGNIGYIWSGLTLFGESPVQASTEEYPHMTGEVILACIGDVNNAVNFSDATIARAHRIPLTLDQLKLLWQFKGSNTWRKNGTYGYFNIPEDVASATRIFDSVVFNAMYNGAPFEIEFRLSFTSPNVFAFVYKDESIFSDENGKYYGKHPCNVYEMDGTGASELLETLLS